MPMSICSFDNLLGSDHKSRILGEMWQGSSLLNFVNHKSCLQMQSTTADLVTGPETLLLDRETGPEFKVHSKLYSKESEMLPHVSCLWNANWMPCNSPVK